MGVLSYSVILPEKAILIVVHVYSCPQAMEVVYVVTIILGIIDN